MCSPHLRNRDSGSGASRVENQPQLFGFLLHGDASCSPPPRPALPFPCLFSSLYVSVRTRGYLFYSLGCNPALFRSDGSSFGHWELCCWLLCPFSTLSCFTWRPCLNFWRSRFLSSFWCVLVIFLPQVEQGQITCSEVWALRIGFNSVDHTPHLCDSCFRNEIYHKSLANRVVKIKRM